MKFVGVVKSLISGTIFELLDRGAEIVYSSEKERKAIIAELDKAGFSNVDWNVYEKNGKMVSLYSGPKIPDSTILDPPRHIGKCAQVYHEVQ